MEHFNFPLGQYLDDGRRPARAQLERVQSLLSDQTDATAAWQALQQQGLTPRLLDPAMTRIFRRISPHHMPDSVERTRFITNMDGGPSALQKWFELDREVPFSVEDALLIAADAAGIEKAESEIRTLCQRLALFEQPMPRRIVWRVMSKAEPTWRVGDSDLIDDINVFLVEAFGRAQHDPPEDPRTGQRPLGNDLWELGAAHGHVFPAEIEDPYYTFPDGPPRVPAAIIGKKIGEVPNPFAPLESLVQLGYWLDTVNKEEAILIVPPR